MFSDLKSEVGLKKLNGYLADKSYIEGFVPTSADVEVFKAVGKAPAAGKFPHVARWYRHLSSFNSGEQGKFAKAKKADYVSGGGAGGKAAAKDDDDDDVDLFGSDEDEEEEDAEKARVREERLKAYAEKKSKKPALIAKTSVLLDVKPWDDETDMEAMLNSVKAIEMDGLLWGASKFVPVGYGIKKLTIMCTVEDDKVSIDELQEKITDMEDFVQSCDVAAMNKI